MTNQPLTTSILHPTDFSTLSERAFDHGLALALRTQAALTLVHVSAGPANQTHWAEFPAVRATLERWGLLHAGSQHQDVEAKLGIQVEKVAALSRKPLPPIVDFINTRAASLVVLATHGREGLPRWLHPSVAEPIARIARVQTLFVPSGARGFVSWDTGQFSLRRILLPIDVSPNPLFAMRAAAQIARLASPTQPVEITALHVNHPETLSAIELLPDPSLKWQQLAEHGDVAEAIFRTATAHDVDLIVMPTRGHLGFLDALRGSTTERVLRRAPCPVLAIPAA